MKIMIVDDSIARRMHPAARFPAGVNTVPSGQTERVDFELNVPRYGPGTLAVVSV